MNINFLEIMVLLIIYLIIRSIMLVVNRKKGKKNYIGKEIMNALLFIYIVILISSTIIPTFVHVKERSLTEEFNNIVWIPLSDYISTIINGEIPSIKFFLRAIIGNIFLLTPLIAYLCCYNKKLRSIQKVLLISFLISLSIESIQFVENIYLGTLRTVNSSDLLLNTIGGLIGYGLFKVIYKTKLRKIIRAK
ncbi:VanZ family protein [Clostridium paraputrificum]|uniref:VanZ family protein n=2 Tax=Clostridiaceae TaxID=31979 RepID=UPI00189F864D|nr:VanZ family protein [Clostridium paraputrificum]